MTYGSCSDRPRRSCMPTAMANEDSPDSRIAVVSTSTDAAAAAALAAADVAGAAGRSSRENATPFDNGASKRSGGDIVMRKPDKMVTIRLTVTVLPWPLMSAFLGGGASSRALSCCLALSLSLLFWLYRRASASVAAAACLL